MKYKVVKNAIDRKLAALLASSLLIEENSGKLSPDEQQVLGSTIVHGNGIMEALMLQLHGLMEQETGLQLLPTYSFARIYRHGHDLKKHKDRPSCEVSTTLTLAYVADEIWPIFADESGPILLDQGDMLIYRGCDVEHWREPLKGQLWVQVFLHYVDVGGPYAQKHAFDGRNLGPFYATLKKYILET